MRKISLVISDEDVSYIELLANYIRNSDFASRFDVKLFSQLEHLNQYLQVSDNVNVLLSSKGFIEGNESIQNSEIETIVILVDEPSSDNTSQSVFKYQPLNNLLSEVITIYYERHGKVEKRVLNDAGTKVVSFYSATGGTGKTTVAYNMARELSAQEKQIFYLNLELISSTPLLFNTKNIESAAPLLYYLKTNSEQLTTKISELKSTDQDTYINYFNFPVSAEEMEDLTADDVKKLIDILVESSEYHYIMIDLDSLTNERALTALSKSDQVFWLLNNDLQSFHKTGYLLEELHGFLKDGSFRERVTLVLNRYTGKLNPILEEYELNIDDYLPYVPEWKEIRTSNQLSGVPIFNKGIVQLFTKYLDGNRGTLDG